MKRLFPRLSQFLFLTLFLGGSILMNASAQTVEPFKRYSKQEPNVRRLSETVDKPSSNSTRIQANLIGIWKRILPANTNLSSGILLSTISFRPGGEVEYNYEVVKEQKTVTRSETYQVIHRGSDGEMPGKSPHVMLKSPAAGDDSVALLLGVSVGYDNRFPVTMGKVLKFKDMDGNESVFIREKSKGYVSRQTQEEVASLPATEESTEGASKENKLVDSAITKELSTKLNERNVDEPERNKAILRLMTEGDSSCVPVLIEHMGTNHTLVVRQNAIRALGKIGDKTAVPALLAILTTSVEGNIDDEAENNAILRRNAVIALRDIGDPKALPTLNNIMAASREYQTVRDLAKNAIRKIENLKQP